MGRGRDLLSAVEVASAKLKPGQKRRYLLDGGGLYLMITRKDPEKPGEKPRKPAEQVSKSWCFRYRSRVKGKPVELGLGSLADVPLAKAREKATAFRGILADGKDPKTEVKAAKATLKVEAAKALTFKQAAIRCIADRRAGWKNAKHADQWENTLGTYAHPIVGELPVGAVDLTLVLAILEPIWTTKAETASRVRQRIEAVLAWATVYGYRKGDNPARWKHNLDQILPATAKVKRQKHHPALAYSRVGAFMEALRLQEGIGGQALEFAILTVSRSNEALGARPEEFDLDRAIWTIPAERMKAKKEHMVPLSPRAVEIVRSQGRKPGELLFSGPKGEAFSDAVMLAVVRRMDNKSLEEGGEGWRDSKGRRVVPHGFRSTFRDWAGECSNFPREVIENALAHKLKDKAEAAYARGTQLSKRKVLMDTWAAFCEKPSASEISNVIPIRSEIG